MEVGIGGEDWVMGRNCSGFAAQNEIIKLQWAALEAVHIKISRSTLDLLFGPEEEEEKAPNANEDKENEPFGFY